MSDTTEGDGRPSSPPERELDSKSEQAMRDLLRGALADEDGAPDLTRGVQRKLRVRSGGKFYADGWSTVKHPPLATYLITSLMMLFVLCIIFALLAPLSGAPEVVKPTKGIQIVPSE